MSFQEPKPVLGAVSYLNTAPLIYGFDEIQKRYSLHLDVPSRLADQLAAGKMSAALIPSVEAMNGQYQIVSDACIACSGPVWSVKLLCRKKIHQVTTVALDEGSRTSAVLTQVLMSRYWNISPEFSPLKLDANYRECECDAVLIIGDRAMHDDKSFAQQYDLGQVWKDWTGLPFVFAVWAANPDSDLAFLERELSKSRDRGVQNVGKIAAAVHLKYGLTSEQCLRYLSHYLRFNLGELERESLRRFAEITTELCLTHQPPSLRFYDCQIA